jgi:hypothetical protein
MPYIRFSEKKIDWRMISMDIQNMFAPQLPYKYFNDFKNTAFSGEDY